MLMGAVFGGGGLHGRAAMSLVFLIILTSPLSWVAFWIEDSFNLAPPYQQILFVVGIAAGAVFNAGVIYLVVGFVSRGLKVIAGKPSK